MADKSERCDDWAKTAIHGDGNVIGDSSQSKVIKNSILIEKAIIEASKEHPSPYQIRRPPDDFKDREKEQDDVLKWIEAGKDIVALRGMGGVGKTDLALVLAARLKRHFSDGQLFLDMMGTGSNPLRPVDAMAMVVRACNPEARIPDNSGEMHGLYLSVLEGKQVLLLVDNAASKEQVQPLLPPKGCLMLITSRLRFHLPDMMAIDLDVLPSADACNLLLANASRIGDHARELADLCGCLPLALRNASGVLAENIDVGVMEYLRRLQDARKRLDLVDASFSLSYNLLSPDKQRLWSMLSVFPADFDRAGAAAVWNMEMDEASEVLSMLVRWSLVNFLPSDVSEYGRYHLHDLARLFALARLPDESRATIAERHATYFRDLLAAANRLYLQGGAGIQAGLALLDREEANIMAGHTRSCERLEASSQAAELCMSYPDAGAYVIDLRLHPKQKISWLEDALKAARKLKNRSAEGAHLGNLGLAYAALGDARKAIEYYEQALVIAREIGDRRNEGAWLGNLGNAYADLGAAKKAIEYYEQALVIAREIGDRRGKGAVLGNLGLAYADLGDAKKAIEHYEQALAIAREIGDRRNEGNWLGNLGNAYADLSNARKAIEYYEQALAIDREIGDRRNEGAWLGNLGNAYADLGAAKRAIEYYEQALVIAREIGDRRGKGAVLGNLGLAYADLGDAKKAIEHYEQALAIAREIGDRRNEGNWLGNLGNAYADLSNARKAIEYYEQALAIDREIGDRRGEGAVLGNLGNAYAALGDARKAIEYYEQHLVIAREIGDRRGEGAVLGNLGNAYAALGDARKAIEYYEQHLVIAREIGDRRGEGNALFNSSLALQELGRHSEAIKNAECALQIFDQIQSHHAERVRQQLAKWRT